MPSSTNGGKKRPLCVKPLQGLGMICNGIFLYLNSVRDMAIDEACFVVI